MRDADNFGAYLTGIHMIIRSAFIFVCACAATWAMADTSDLSGDYQGTINGHIRITMNLVHSTDGADDGQYRYVRFGQPVFLRDQTKPGGQIDLAEDGDRGGDSLEGHFRGTCDDDNNFAGIWTNSDGTKSYPFSLKRVDTIEKYSTSEPKYRVAASVPHFVADTPFYVALSAELRRRAREEVRSETAELRTDTSDPDSGPLPYVSTSSMELLYAADTLVSVLRQGYDYSGGAHGNYGFSAETFAWRGNKLIELHPSDLLYDDSAPQLASLIRADLKRQKASWPEQATLSKLDRMTMNPTADGLVFTFDPYEVDCFAAGSYSVMIPYSQISTCIPPQSPLAHLVR